MRRLALDVHGELLATTPVDTGWARTNWVPRVGAPFEGTAGTRLDAENGQLDRSPMRAGVAAVRAFDAGQVESDIHVTNNVPYIESLNAGTSAQAPPAFVQGAIVRAIEATGARRSEEGA